MPSRSWMLAAALGLVLPGLLLVASLWIERSGLLDSLRSQERQQADARLEEFRQDFARELAERCTQPGAPVFVLVLDADGSPTLPFHAGSLPLSTQAVAEHAQLRTAHQLERAGESERAAQFFAWVAAQSELPLPARAEIAWARATCDARGVRAMQAQLAERIPESDMRTDLGVPLPLLARLLEIEQLAQAGNETESTRCALKLLHGDLRIATAFAPTVASWIADLRPGVDAEPRQRFLAAARVAEELARGVGPDPDGFMPADAYCALRLDASRVAVFATEFSTAVAAELGSGLRDGLHLGLATGAGPALRSWDAPAIRGVVQVAPEGSLPSDRLAQLARVLLWSAAFVFVFGNLWLLAIVRRELQVARLKQDFVDLVSHELRTPLTAIALKSEMLSHGDVPWNKQRGYLRALHGDVRRLVELVERILDFARLAKGRFPLARAHVDTRSLLARAIAAGRPALRLSQQRLHVEAQRELPKLYVDSELLTRALRNLLENAAKFAPPGSRVHLTAELEGAEVVLRVRDEGVGLDEAELRTIFEPFERGAEAKATTGTGLGLALVAQAVRVHGGRVEAQAAASGGAEFLVRLPVDDGAAA